MKPIQLLPQDFSQHRGIYVTATFLVVISVVFVVNFLPKLQQPIIQSYEECVKSQSSVIQESYPAVCITGDGQRFVQPTPTPQAPTNPSTTSTDIESYES